MEVRIVLGTTCLWKMLQHRALYCNYHIGLAFIICNAIASILATLCSTLHLRLVSDTPCFKEHTLYREKRKGYPLSTDGKLRHKAKWFAQNLWQSQGTNPDLLSQATWPLNDYFQCLFQALSLHSFTSTIPWQSATLTPLLLWDLCSAWTESLSTWNLCQRAYPEEPLIFARNCISLHTFLSESQLCRGAPLLTELCSWLLCN